MAGTRWVKLDVQYFSNPKVVALVDQHPRAVLLHLAMCAYCGQELTDGFVPTPMWSRLGHHSGISRAYRVRAAMQILGDAGLVHMVPGGCMVHDWLVLNPQLNRASVEAERDRWRQAKRGIRGGIPGGTIDSIDNDVPAPRRDESRYIPLQDDVTGVDVHRPEDNGHGA